MIGLTDIAHVRSGVADLDAATRVSDWIGDAACLMRIDPVHHKLAVFRGDEPGLCHMNFRVASIDDVFRNWHFLVEHGRVIAPGQPGFGGTATGEPRTYGRAAWTAHALALPDALGAGAADITGNSMGGAIALSLAVARPRAVRRIVLTGSTGAAMALPPGLGRGAGPHARGRAGARGHRPVRARPPDHHR